MIPEFCEICIPPSSGKVSYFFPKVHTFVIICHISAPLPIQYIRRKHNERGLGRMGEGNQHRREDGDEPEICRRHNTARWDQ